MGRATLYNGRAGLAVMLSTREVHGDLYDSTYELPIPARSFSTERKLVHKGEGPLLERFLAEPVRRRVRSIASGRPRSASQPQAWKAWRGSRPWGPMHRLAR